VPGRGYAASSGYRLKRSDCAGFGRLASWIMRRWLNLIIKIPFPDRSTGIGQDIVNNIGGYFSQDKASRYIMQAPGNLIQQGRASKLVDRLGRAQLNDQAPERQPESKQVILHPMILPVVPALFPDGPHREIADKCNVLGPATQKGRSQQRPAAGADQPECKSSSEQACNFRATIYPQPGQACLPYALNGGGSM
jgi:hypothetical protein